MSNETKFFFGTPKTLEANGASVANNAIGTADDANYDVVSDGGGYPDGVFTLSCACSSAFTEGTVIGLYARPLDIDSTNDTEVPETGRPTWPVAQFVVNNVTSTQYIYAVGRDLPKLATYYLHNNGTGQTISTGWTLKITPRTYGPA